MKKTTFVFTLLCGICLVATSQSSKSEILAEVKRVGEKYYLPNKLSFDIQYRYASEDNPKNWLDSLFGHYSVSPEGIMYSINNTESIVNEEQTIILFNDDKLMYVTRGNTDQTNPLALLDSIFVKNVIKYDLKKNGSETIIQLDFPPNSSYKEITYVIDSKSGLLRQITQLVKSDLLLDPSVNNLSEQNSYAEVQIQFLNYSEKVDNTRSVKSENYFTRKGSTLVCTPAYESYKIFVGSPNL